LASFESQASEYADRLMRLKVGYGGPEPYGDGLFHGVTAIPYLHEVRPDLSRLNAGQSSFDTPPGSTVANPTDGELALSIHCHLPPNGSMRYYYAYYYITYSSGWQALGYAQPLD
jgi:hypothetical protein